MGQRSNSSQGCQKGRVIMSKYYVSIQFVIPFLICSILEAESRIDLGSWVDDGHLTPHHQTHESGLIFKKPQIMCNSNATYDP